MIFESKADTFDSFCRFFNWDMLSWVIQRIFGSNSVLSSSSEERITTGDLALLVVIYNPVCIQHCITQSAAIGYICVRCICDCLSVFVTAEPVYSSDQYSHSCSNPYKLYISDWCFATVRII